MYVIVLQRTVAPIGQTTPIHPTSDKECIAYVESRTLGLPGLPSWEPFTEPPGLLSLLLEAIFVGMAAYVLGWKRKATASSGEVM
jgi:hypothetical protein